jgi:uncharacterized UPF0160 family protein
MLTYEAKKLDFHKNTLRLKYNHKINHIVSHIGILFFKFERFIFNHLQNTYSWTKYEIVLRMLQKQSKSSRIKLV